MNLREATEQDLDGIWPIFHEVVAEGKTYPYPRDLTREGMLEWWFRLPLKTYVYEEDGRILGTYYLKENSPGLGSHVCNCGYMVASEARGRGIGRVMGEHSLKAALTLGFKAMQFNLVVVTNKASVRLWKTLGFETVGRLPKAFNHASQGYVDALVMYKWL